MKIAIAGGHSKKAPGASGYLDEYDCDRAFVAKLIPALAAAGHAVVNCSNEKGDQSSELAEEVRLANGSGSDLFIAVHFNAGGGTGTECFTYTGTTSQLAKDVCAKMSANVAAALGIRNRGAKQAGFYVLRKTSMPAVLLEVCFVDNETDRDAWNRTSWEALCDAVVKAVGGTATTAPAPQPAPAPAPAPKPAAKPSVKDYQAWLNRTYGYNIAEDGKFGPDSKRHAVMALQTEYNRQFGEKLAVDGRPGPATKAAWSRHNIRRGANGNITRNIQGLLIARGYDPNGFDSSFGPGCEAAVIAFQKANGLSDDGVVGSGTFSVLTN